MAKRKDNERATKDIAHTDRSFRPAWPSLRSCHGTRIIGQPQLVNWNNITGIELRLPRRLASLRAPVTFSHS